MQLKLGIVLKSKGASFILADPKQASIVISIHFLC